MKKITTFFIVSTYFIIGACNSSSNKNETQTNNNTSQTFNLDTTKLKRGSTFYQCEMNPEVISDKSGACPKCGMDLEKMIKK